MIGLYEKLCIMIGMVKNNNKKYMMGFKKVFYNSIKWLEMIELYEKLCIMIGMVNNNNNKYMMDLFKLFKLYSSDPWVLFNLHPGMGFWIKTQFEYWILLRNKRTLVNQPNTNCSGHGDHVRFVVKKSICKWSIPEDKVSREARRAAEASPINK